MPERMVGPGIQNSSDNTYISTVRGLYQLRNDDNDKLRFQAKFQVTEVGGDIKVDLFVFDFACLGNA